MTVDAIIPRVFLLGMMGVGKSTVGKPLASLLGWPYLDNDVLLAEREGKGLLEVAAMGAEVLHADEASIALELCRRPPHFVASLAASVVESSECRSRLHQDGFAVYLRASPEVLAARTAKSSKRPWLDTDPQAWFASVLAQREPGYLETAHLVADVDRDDPGLVAQRIALAVSAQE